MLHPAQTLHLILLLPFVFVACFVYFEARAKNRAGCCEQARILWDDPSFACRVDREATPNTPGYNKTVFSSIKHLAYHGCARHEVWVAKDCTRYKEHREFIQSFGAAFSDFEN